LFKSGATKQDGGVAILMILLKKVIFHQVREIFRQMKKNTMEFYVFTTYTHFILSDLDTPQKDASPPTTLACQVLV
jgi:hypothetical protein